MAKRIRFDKALRSRGYRKFEHSDYGGRCSYVKEHTYNVAECAVTKDAHGKVIGFNFCIYDAGRLTQDMTEFEMAACDRAYLTKEARALYKAFTAELEVR